MTTKAQSQAWRRRAKVYDRLILVAVFAVVLVVRDSLRDAIIAGAAIYALNRIGTALADWAERQTDA